MFSPLVAIRLMMIMGIISLITGILIFLSCRCIPSANWGSKLMKNRTYKRFYKYHCYLWMVFCPSVIIHAILAIIFAGWPG
ncbi:MAG: hypothetical protein PHN78_03485 [Dehalococcoidales bacterium]|nr:hypothetical protein [Dehalococcoidales bacterium]